MDDVTLRPITLSDTDDIVRWRNSDAVRFNMLDQRKLNAEQHRDYYHIQIETRKIIQYIIIADGFAIGTVFYKKLSHVIVEIGLFIGEGAYCNKRVWRSSYDFDFQRDYKRKKISKGYCQGKKRKCSKCQIV